LSKQKDVQKQKTVFKGNLVQMMCKRKHVHKLAAERGEKLTFIDLSVFKLKIDLKEIKYILMT